MKIRVVENKILNFFVVVALLDPANIFIGIKSMCFIIFIGILLINKEKTAGKYIPSLILLYFISIISSLMGRLYGYEINEGMFVQYLTTFSVLIILLWYKKFDIISTLQLPSILLSILTISIYVIMIYFPELETAIYAFAKNNDNIFQMSHRIFLGVEFISCYYTPLIIVSIPYAFSLYNFLFEKDNKRKSFVLSILYMTALFCGGNRACLFGVSFVFVIIIIAYLRKKKYFKPLTILIIPIILISATNTLYNAATEKEDSNEIKWKHLQSYEKLYDDNPLLIFTGMGAGGVFYSKGFNAKTPLVEWQYIEIIRWFGIFGGTFLILFCFYPMFYVFSHRKKYLEWLPFVSGYCCYMFMSAGNPYLMNSTGMIAVLTGYTYIYHHKIKK